MNSFSTLLVPLGCRVIAIVPRAGIKVERKQSESA
jgi:hypothetical protein